MIVWVELHIWTQFRKWRFNPLLIAKGQNSLLLISRVRNSLFSIASIMEHLKSSSLSKSLYGNPDLKQMGQHRELPFISNL